MNRSRTDWLLLAGFCAFLFFFGLNSFGLIGADEPRYAQVAREMLARHDWITPVLGGKPWLEKPPLYYWQAMIAYSIFGVSDWVARLPSAVDATVMVLAVYFFLRRFRRGFELDGALIAASCAAVIAYARAASMDMALTTTCAVAMLCWYTWYETDSKPYLAGFYASLALGTLAKGPVAPFLAAVVIVCFALAQGKTGVVLRTLWIPGIALFLVLSLPWYVLVQTRNPEFFRIFILEHNLARFGSNLYHHPEPFWYYLPVTLLGLLPWTVFVIAAVVESVRVWWSEGKALFETGDAFNAFLVLWLIVPVVFFSASQSKLPGYIVPAIPAAALLLAEYIRRHATEENAQPRAVLTLHSLFAAAPLAPALVLSYLVLQHRFPWNRAGITAIIIAVLVALAIAITLLRRPNLALLRFVTLIPIVLVVAAVLRIGAPSLDASLSARPIAREIGAIETAHFPTAVFDVSRETDYGLAFYRNQIIAHYEWNQIPQGGHFLIATEGHDSEISTLAGGRRVSHLGSFAPQHLEYYWVSPVGAMSMQGMEMR
jgi:4-amino-4-deoxy-L-arabinose transferase-like glycosyltransferase